MICCVVVRDLSGGVVRFGVDVTIQVNVIRTVGVVVISRGIVVRVRGIGGDADVLLLGLKVMWLGSVVMCGGVEVLWLGDMGMVRVSVLVIQL